MTQVSTTSYEASFDVEFKIEDGVDIINWTDPENGETKHRMTGIYPNIVTVEDIKRHWTFNLLANGVRDASELDGWADLPKGSITFGIVWHSVEVTTS